MAFNNQTSNNTNAAIAAYSTVSNQCGRDSVSMIADYNVVCSKKGIANAGTLILKHRRSLHSTYA